MRVPEHHAPPVARSRAPEVAPGRRPGGAEVRRRLCSGRTRSAPLRSSGCRAPEAGSTVPLKFEVFAGSTELTSTSIIQQPLSLTKLACAAGTEHVVEITATGNTSLRYDTTGCQFFYNWQPPKPMVSGRRLTATALVRHTTR